MTPSERGLFCKQVAQRAAGSTSLALSAPPAGSFKVGSLLDLFCVTHRRPHGRRTEAGMGWLKNRDCGVQSNAAAGTWAPGAGGARDLALALHPTVPQLLSAVGSQSDFHLERDTILVAGISEGKCGLSPPCSNMTD